MQISDPLPLMRRAIVLAEQAELNGEVPVGALIVYDGKIIAEAHNLMESAGLATKHAELLAIEQASKALGNWRLSGASLFVTLEPCPMCIGAALLARVSELYFGCADSRLGAAGSVFDLSNHPLLPHRLRVYQGVLEEECRALLRRFFQGQRSAEQISATKADVGTFPSVAQKSRWCES